MTDDDTPDGRDADPSEDRPDASPDRREDPFDELDVDRGIDRGGDPFEHLPDEGRGEAADPGESESESDPFEYRETVEPDGTSDRGGSAGPSDEEDASGPPGDAVDVAANPLGDVDVSRGDPFESADSPFEQVDVGEVDPDAVWDQFTDDGDGETASVPDSGVANGPDTGPGPDSAADPGDDVVEVSKHSFCEGCQHFSPPPDVACGHRGTEILEFVGMDDVRVSNCPVVAEQRELGEIE